MLNIFTSQKVRSRMESGPMGPYLSAIAAELQQQGYARSTIRRHLRAADHFGAWLVKHGLSLKDISEPLVDHYLKGLNRQFSSSCSGGRPLHKALGIPELVRFLRRQGVLQTDVEQQQLSPTKGCLIDFDHRLDQVAGRTCKEAGYKMQFTVYGRHMDINVPTDQIGRYVIDSLKGNVFKAALDFGATDSTQPGVETGQLASAGMLTEPLNDQHITESKPTIKANLASMGDVDPKSVEMRISRFGLVPASYDPRSKLVSYTFMERLSPRMYTVILTAKVSEKKVETRWDFTVDKAKPVASRE